MTIHDTIPLLKSLGENHYAIRDAHLSHRFHPTYRLRGRLLASGRLSLENDDEMTPYNFTDEDLTAEDWRIYRDGEERSVS